MKTIVLLSSGLDSTVNFYQALKNESVTLALTFNYGQRSANKEIQSAKKLCDLNSVAHKVVNVPWFSEFTNTSLVNVSKDVPQNMEIDNLEDCHKTAQSVWVPNRNGIFLNIAAGFAEGLGADQILVGFNKEEAATFPDNSKDYLNKVNKSFELSTLKKIKVECYTIDMNKTEIVRLGKKLKVPFESIWSCYMDGEKPCGQCESCLRFQRAMKEA